MQDELPNGIDEVRKTWNPDEARMKKAVRLMLDWALLEKVKKEGTKSERPTGETRKDDSRALPPNGKTA